MLEHLEVEDSVHACEAGYCLASADRRKECDAVTVFQLLGAIINWASVDDGQPLPGHNSLGKLPAATRRPACLPSLILRDWSH